MSISGPAGGGVGWPWALLWLVLAVLFQGGLIAMLMWAMHSSAGKFRAPIRVGEIFRRLLTAEEISEEEYERI